MDRIRERAAVIEGLSNLDERSLLRNITEGIALNRLQEK